MKKTVLAVLAAIVYTIGFTQTGDTIAIIPQPVKLARTEGYFTLPASVLVYDGGDTSLHTAVSVLKQHLVTAAQCKVTLTGTKNPSATIILTLTSMGNTLGDEGYHLTVGPHKVIIMASKPAGILYGIQTLLQLLPPAIESKTAVKNIAWKAPCVDIEDYPRFGWRGLMLDVSRHFFTKQQVKDFIDDMVRYKYNMLHMHLTDDQGWRIEIKSLPKLTTIGACRVHKEGYFGSFTPPTPDEPRDECGLRRRICVS